MKIFNIILLLLNLAFVSRTYFLYLKVEHDGGLGCDVLAEEFRTLSSLNQWANEEIGELHVRIQELEKK